MLDLETWFKHLYYNKKKNVALGKNRVIQEGKSFKSNNEWYI